MNRAFLLSLFFLALLPGAAGALTEEGFEGRSEEVVSLVAARKYAEAEAAARALLAESETAFGEDAVQTGRALDLLVDARLGQRAVDEECLALAEHAVRIKEEAAGPEEPETAESLRRLGLVLQARQRFADARAPLERALAIQEARFGKGSAEAADVLARLAFLYRDLHLEAEAARLLEETLQIRESAEPADPGSLGPLIYNLAVLKMSLGDLDASERLYERLLEITPDSSGQERSVAWNGLGMVCVEQARFVEAQDAFEKAIAAAKEAGAHPTMIAYFLHNLGFLLKELGAYDEAVHVFDEALEIRRSVDGPQHLDTAATLANLANTYLLLGDVERAGELHEQALAIRRTILGPDHAEVAMSMRFLGEVRLKEGRTDEACGLLRDAREILEGRLGPDHYDVFDMTARYARALEAAGDLPEAEARYRSAVVGLERTLGKDSPTWAEAALGLAKVAAERGNIAEAWRIALEAEERSREHARVTASGLSERRALHYAAVTKDALDLVLSLAPSVREPNAGSVALDRLIRSRALVLDVIVTRRAALSRDDPETAELFRKHREASRALASLLIEGPGDRSSRQHADAVEDAQTDLDRAERALASRSTAFRRSLDRRTFGLPELLAARPPGAAVVSFAKFGRIVLDGTPDGAGTPAYAAFVLAPGSDRPVLLDLGEAAAIEALVGGWRREIALPQPEPADEAIARYRTAGEALRREIWDPVARGLGPGPDLLFLVPDGELHRVSFATLPVGDTDYLLDEGTPIHYLAAERDLRPSEGPGVGRGLFAAGGIEFGDATGAAPTFRGPLGDVRFAALPETADEVRSIADLWNDNPGTTHDAALVLLGADATEEAVKREAPGHRVVHLATHGFFLGDRDEEARPGTRSIGGLSAKRPVPDFGGLALSGLALAGANRAAAAGDDDGILTAQEIASLDLRGTEWVVLSACDTGLGEVQTGEGVLGLRRAFEVSGAQTLVMSLWEVDDEATGRWMRALYDARIVDGRTTTECMMAACRDVRAWSRDSRNTDHPFYWGAFVAVGDWR